MRVLVIVGWNNNIFPLILTTITHSLDANLVVQLQKTDSSQSFGQYVYQLFFCRYVVDDDSALVDALTDVVVAQVNVLAPLVEDGVLAQRDGRLVVHQ
jgi:hypothetical protein